MASSMQLNQIKNAFSIIPRKALPPDDFRRLEAAAERLSNLARCIEITMQLSEWEFTRCELEIPTAPMSSCHWQRQQVSTRRPSGTPANL
jgi:hypothetical protein